MAEVWTHRCHKMGFLPAGALTGFYNSCLHQMELGQVIDQDVKIGVVKACQSITRKETHHLTMSMVPDFMDPLNANILQLSIKTDNWIYGNFHFVKILLKSGIHKYKFLQPTLHKVNQIVSLSK